MGGILTLSSGLCILGIKKFKTLNLPPSLFDEIRSRSQIRINKALLW
ncbi:hypothetical protein [Bacillus haynesii]